MALSKLVKGNSENKHTTYKKYQDRGKEETYLLPRSVVD